MTESAVTHTGEKKKKSFCCLLFVFLSFAATPRDKVLRVGASLSFSSSRNFARALVSSQRLLQDYADSVAKSGR